MYAPYLRTAIQMTFFIMVLSIKIKDQNDQYFQVIFSLILTLILIPLNRFMKNYEEHSQLVFQSLWQILNLFCLGSVDTGLEYYGFLNRFQYFWLGFTIQLEVDSIPPHKVVRIGFVIVVIAAVNLTQIYLLEDLSWIGMIFGEILFAMILVYQIANECSQNKNEQITKSKKHSSRSFTEKLESPQPQQLNDEDSNQVNMVSLTHGLGRHSQHSQNHSIIKEIEQQNNFYKLLFNQFPEGIVILDDQTKIEYHNNQIPKLLASKQLTKDEILQKLFELRNYSAKFEEQAQFDKMFSALNKQLKNNSKQLQTDEVSSNYLDDNFTEFNYDDAGLSKADTLQIEIEKALQDKQLLPSPIQRQASQQTVHTQKQEKIKFISEVKMLCVIEGEEDKLQEFMEQSDKDDEKDDKQSSLLLIQVTLKPYFYEGKKSLLLMLRDVSLFNQYKVLQQQNQNKSKMLSYVAHELRNPLNAITGICEALIAQIKDRDLINRFLKPLKISTDSMNSLVKDLLDMAQLKAGKFKLTIQEFQLKELLFDAVTMMTYVVNAKKLQLNLRYDKKIPLFIKSDQQRIQQIVLNLINNSNKFTKTGGIIVEAKLIKQKQIEISVEDTGLGIKSEDINKLFQPFGKLDDQNNLNGQGIGLGLMISNVLAQKLSGIDQGLQVESKGLGMGTRFRFLVQDQQNSLIQQQQNDYQTSSIHQSQDTKQFGRKESNLSVVYVQKREPLQSFHGQKYKTKVISEKQIEDGDNNEYRFEYNEDDEEEKNYLQEKDSICQQNLDEDIQALIVDDESVNLTTLGFMLGSLNIKYQKAQSGNECIKILKQLTGKAWVKYILIDVSMPGMDGYATTKVIRELEQKKNKKSIIIGCSGYSDEESKQFGLKSGMDYYIVKPLKKEYLAPLLQQHN